MTPVSYPRRWTCFGMNFPFNMCFFAFIFVHGSWFMVHVCIPPSVTKSMLAPWAQCLNNQSGENQTIPNIQWSMIFEDIYLPVIFSKQVLNFRLKISPFQTYVSLFPSIFTQHIEGVKMCYIDIHIYIYVYVYMYIDIHCPQLRFFLGRFFFPSWVLCGLQINSWGFWNEGQPE